jgi:outer membrane protein
MKCFAILILLASVGVWAKPASQPAPSKVEKFEEVEQEPPLPDLSADKDDAINLKLEDCVRLAIRGATTVLKAQNAVESTGAALLQSYGQFLPSVTAQASSTYTSGTVYFTQSTPTLVNGSSQSLGYGLSADLNIFNGLSDLGALRASMSRKSASDLSLYRAKQAIALDITQSFLTVLLDVRLVQIAKKNLEESRARERLLIEQTRVGSKNLSDLFRQQAQTSADEALVLTSENNKTRAQVILVQKLRLDQSKNYHVVDFQNMNENPDPRFDNENSLVDIGLAHRADLKANQDVANAAHWDIRGKVATYLPKIDFVAGLSSLGSYLYSQNVGGVSMVPPTQTSLTSQLSPQTDYSFGVVLTWTLFDRLMTNQNISQAQATARNADIDAEDLKNRVQAEVKVGYNSYKTAIQQLHSSKKGLEAAQKAYEVIEGRYEVGSANFIDLITVQASLLQAESTRAQTLIDFILQGREVEFAIGQIDVN